MDPETPARKLSCSGEETEENRMKQNYRQCSEGVTGPCANFMLNMMYYGGKNGVSFFSSAARHAPLDFQIKQKTALHLN